MSRRKGDVRAPEPPGRGQNRSTGMSNANDRALAVPNSRHQAFEDPVGDLVRQLTSVHLDERGMMQQLNAKAPEQYNEGADLLRERRPRKDVRKEQTGSGIQKIAKPKKDADAPALPILAFKREIVWTCAANTVSVVKGDTGSGKSSQTPQYLLETSLLASGTRRPDSSDAVFVPPEVWGDSPPMIYVTQPRRVAAVTLARRVAEEQGEAAGGTIGYRIGHESSVSKATQVTFCTCGWLLQWLVHSSATSQAELDAAPSVTVDPSFVRPDIPSGGAGGLTHIILDEVHERGIDTDLVCLLVKLAAARGLQARAQAIEYLRHAVTSGMPLEAAGRQAWLIYARRTRLILMSATFDTSVFTQYFGTMAADHAARLKAQLCQPGGRAALDTASVLSLPVQRFIAPKEGLGYPEAQKVLERGLLTAMQVDAPATLYVGAKRYPVATHFLEDIVALPEIKQGAGMSRQESEGVGSLVQAFERAVVNWQRKKTEGPRGGGGGGGGGGGADPEAGGSVGDALILQEQQQGAVQKLAARLALSVARPGTGDCILIFVSGMADIDAMVAAFHEIAPGRVAAPVARLASGEVMEDDADQIAMEEAAAHTAQQLAQADGDGGREGYDSEEEEEEEEERRRGGPRQTASAGRALAPVSTTPVDNSTIRLLPMHSLISFEDQMAAFDTSGTDKRTRVVIATNIAESSVTLPDVHTVIDTCRTKTVEFVPKVNASMLRTTWASQASAQQRTGRCGRLMPGTCYRLVTRSFFDRVMPPYELPEMLRLSLDTVVLKVKMLGILVNKDMAEAAAASNGTAGRVGKLAAAGARADPNSLLGGAAGQQGGVSSAKAVLAASIQPPEASNVDAALVKLAALGALATSSDSAEVTPFGRVLAAFPGDLALGKLVAFGACMGCVTDAIVMAAGMAAQDVFLMPHAAMASSPGEYAATVSKVARARALFGRDSTLALAQVKASQASGSGRDGLMAALVDPYAGSGGQSWSEPITLRNAYVAWRCVADPKARAGWCAAYGIVARRMTTVHSMVKEIGSRIANDAPTLAPMIKALLGERPPRGANLSDPVYASAAALAASWPPPGLFTTDTHLLRVILVAAQLGNLCIGDAMPRVKAAAQLAQWQLDPRRSITLKLARAPPAWWQSITLQGAPDAAFGMGGGPMGGSAGAGSSPIATLPGAFPDSAAARRPYMGAIATALATVGIPRDRISRLAGAPKTGLIGFELDGDWEADKFVLQAGRFAPEWRGGREREGGDALARPGMPLPGRLSDTTAALVGAGRGGYGSSFGPAASSGGSVIVSSRGRPSSLLPLPLRPIAYALPISAMGFMLMAGMNATVALPQPKGKDSGAGMVDALTGVRAHVIGANWVEDKDKMGKKDPSTAPVEAGADVPGTDVSSVWAVTWKTQGSVSGQAAFGSSPRMPSAGGPKGKGSALTFMSRPAQQSLVRLLADMGVPGNGTLEAAAAAETAGAKGDKGGRGGGKVDKGAPSEPLLSVCSSLQLQERQQPGGGKDREGDGGKAGGGVRVTAAMAGTTVLWRDPTALALSMLTFGRGIEACLTWTAHADARARRVVCVTLDPRGPEPLRLAPTDISCEDLRRVNAVRGRLSCLLASPDLGASLRAPADRPVLPLSIEVMDLLGLATDGQQSVKQPTAFAPGGTFNVLVTDFAVVVTGEPYDLEFAGEIYSIPPPLTTGRRGGTPADAVDARRVGARGSGAPSFDVHTLLLSPLRTDAGDALTFGAHEAVTAGGGGGGSRPAGKHLHFLDDDDDEYFSDDEEGGGMDFWGGGQPPAQGHGSRGGGRGRGGPRGGKRGGREGGGTERDGGAGRGGRGGKRGGKPATNTEKAIAAKSSQRSREQAAGEMLEQRRVADKAAQAKKDRDLIENSFAAKQERLEAEANKAATRGKAAVAPPPPPPRR